MIDRLIPFVDNKKRINSILKLLRMLPLRPVLDNPCLQATSSRRPKNIFFLPTKHYINHAMQVMHNRKYVDISNTILFSKITFQHTISIICTTIFTIAT